MSLGVLGGLSAGAGLLGNIMGLLGSLGLGQQEVPIQNVNPYTDQTMKQFQGLLGMSDQDMSRLLGQAGNTAGRLGGVQSDLQGLQGDIGGVSSPGVNAGYNLYQDRQGQLADQAQSLAQMLTQPYQEAAGDVANRRADQAARDVMGQFGGQGFSGAAQAAAGGAASDVLSDYESNVANMFGQIGSGLTGQMLGQERGMAEAAPQQQFANIINQLLQQAGLANQRGSSIGQEAGLYGSLGSEYGARSRQLLSGLGALSQPQFQEQVTTNPFMEAGTMFGGLGEDFFGSLYDMKSSGVF